MRSWTLGTLNPPRPPSCRWTHRPCSPTAAGVPCTSAAPPHLCSTHSASTFITQARPRPTSHQSAHRACPPISPPGVCLQRAGACLNSWHHHLAHPVQCAQVGAKDHVLKGGAKAHRVARRPAQREERDLCRRDRPHLSHIQRHGSGEPASRAGLAGERTLSRARLARAPTEPLSLRSLLLGTVLLRA